MARRIIIGEQEFNVPDKFPKSGFAVALLLVVLFMLWSSIYRVELEVVGVLLTLGKYSGETKSGLHLKWPAPLQKVIKVQLPMAIPSIMLGINQGVMMALAMQVITPMIGGAGLGKDVFYAINTSETGNGLAAGIGVVILAVILDRWSQAWTKKQRTALDL